MENEIKFYTTTNVRRILWIGNKTCLDLFHHFDFPCIKVGKSFKVAVNSFNEYINTHNIKRRFKYGLFFYIFSVSYLL